MENRKRSKRERDAEQEILAEGERVLENIDWSQGLHVPAKNLSTNKLISIRLPVGMIKSLRIVAQRKGGVGYQHVIKMYVAEGLERDNHPWQQRVSVRQEYPLPSEYSATSNRQFVVRESRPMWAKDLRVNIDTSTEAVAQQRATFTEGDSNAS